MLWGEGSFFPSDSIEFDFETSFKDFRNHMARSNESKGDLCIVFYFAQFQENNIIERMKAFGVIMLLDE